MRINVQNPHNVTVEQVERDIAQCSGFVKMMTGVANNCAYCIMMDALDQLRQHPRYADKKIKRMFEGKANSVLAFYKQYRNGLRWPMGNEVRFFHIADMPPEARKKYGSPVTDEQYFEFWEATGAMAYTKSRPWVTSLWNKFRLSLVNHGVPNADLVGWGLVGSSALEMAVETWERSMRSVHEAVPVLTQKVIERIYRPFNLDKVAQQWHKSLYALAPETSDYKLTEIEEKNIAIGLNQLRELWASPELPFDATIKAVEDYQEEIFNSKNQAKKSIIQLKKMQADAIEDIAEQKRKQKENDRLRGTDGLSR